MKYEKKDEIATVDKMNQGTRAKDLAVKEWNSFVALNMKQIVWKPVSEPSAQGWCYPSCMSLAFASWDLAETWLSCTWNTYWCSVSICICASVQNKQMVKDFLSSRYLEASKWSNDPLLYKDETGLAKLANTVCG